MIAFARSSFRALRRAGVRLRTGRAWRALILMYHRIDDQSPDPWRLSVSESHFSEQLNCLQKKFEIVSLAELLQKKSRGKSSRSCVAITFDDGYADNLAKAVPRLEQQGVPATFFVTTGGTKESEAFWWDELDRLLLTGQSIPEKLELKIGSRLYQWNAADLSELCADVEPAGRNWDPVRDSPHTPAQALHTALYPLLQRVPEVERQAILGQLAAALHEPISAVARNRRLTRDEILQLSRSPCATIGGHTATHPLLPSISLPEQEHEIAKNRAALEHITGSKALHFSYPHGAASPGTIQLVKRCGFESACSTIEGVVSPSRNPFELPRIAVENWTGLEFERQLERWLCG